MRSSRLLERLLCCVAAVSPAFDVARLFAVGAAAALFLLFCGSFWLESGSASYQDWANGLIHGGDLTKNSALQWRDIGYALIMVAGGFPFTDSFIGVVVIQALMGIAMPLLAYFTLQPWFPRAAYYTALASIFSLAPFLFVKMIHHDQPYIFFTVLSLCLFNRYIFTKRPVYIYALTVAMFGVALHRLLGRYFFALLLLTAAGQRRLNFKHYVAAFLIFSLGLAGYLAYREKALGAPTSILGQQIFQNVYLNSAEYGRPLTPDVGPYTKLVMEQTRARLLPSPSESQVLKDSPGSPIFKREYFYRYTTDELFRKIFEEPNTDYLLVIWGANSDPVLLKASLEVALKRPFYILRYTLRSVWKFLYDPGWGHGSFSDGSFGRLGLDFPMGGSRSKSIGDTIAERAPERALKELGFIPLARQPALIRDIYFLVEDGWHETYRAVVKLLFFLMAVTWISTVIGLLTGIVRTPKLRRLSRLWLSDKVTAASLGLSALFFANIGITALLVDPLPRYDFSLMMLRFMLAGIGAAVLTHVFRHFEAGIGFRFAQTHIWPHGLLANIETRELAYSNVETDGRNSWSRSRVAATAAVLIALLISCLGSWIWQVKKYAAQLPAEHTIHIKSAECLYSGLHVLPVVRSLCSGERQCSYTYDPRDFGGGTCDRPLRIDWTCTKDGPLLSRSWARVAEATPIQISCD